MSLRCCYCTGFEWVSQKWFIYSTSECEPNESQISRLFSWCDWQVFLLLSTNLFTSFLPGYARRPAPWCKDSIGRQLLVLVEMDSADGICVPSTEFESEGVRIIKISNVDFEVQVSWTEHFPFPVLRYFMTIDVSTIWQRAIQLKQSCTHND